jgi:putative tricarboxylic transport membrane protein
VKVSDRVSGFLLVALGALTCYAASLLPTIAGQQIGPQVFPTVIGVALIACGVMIMIGVGSGFEDEEKLIVSEAGDLAKHQEAESLADRIGVLFAGGWKVVMPPLALFFYFLVSEKLGFWISAFLIIFTLSQTMGAKLRWAIIVSLIAPALIHLIFYKLLRVPLPAGLLPFPWV